MSRPVHFEIHVDDMPRAQAFYAAAFGWQFQDWSEYAGMPYAGIVTGPEGSQGINGALMKRRGVPLAEGAPINGAVLTMGVEDFDAAAAKIQGAGGSIAMPKYALPGMAWQGYFVDTEGNVFGVHQPDENAA